MAPSYNFLMALMLSTFLGGVASLKTQVLDRAIPATIQSVGDVSERSSNTCADPTLARPVYEGFSGVSLSHVLRFHWDMVNLASQQPSGPVAWSFQGPVFKAWPSQQPFTVPLFQLATPAFSDYIFMAGTDAQTPPVVSGFNADDPVAWVYDTPVCGSVPLMSAFFAATTDHYYTADPEEHAALLASGWADAGVVAYVLPLPTF